MSYFVFLQGVLYEREAKLPPFLIYFHGIKNWGKLGVRVRSEKCKLQTEELIIGTA